MRGASAAPPRGRLLRSPQSADRRQPEGNLPAVCRLLSAVSFREERLELPIEPDRPLGHRAVPGAVVDRGPRVPEPVAVAGGVGRGNDAVITPPHDYGRGLDAPQAVEEVVADQAADRGQEALGAGA